MHDERDYRELERRIDLGAPAPVEEEAIERVLLRTKERASAPGAAPLRTQGTTRLLGGRATRVAVGLALAVVAVAVGMRFSLSGPELTMAFAKEDALAALIPKPGYVLHLKTSEWAQNYGEDKPINPGDEYQESWSDFGGQRGHTYWRKKADDKLVGEAVVAEGRARLSLDPDTLEPDMTPLSEGPAPEGVIGGELYVYEYIRESLPEGKVVGEVVIDGERYWDMRWEGVRDEGGLKLNARALFRQPDYRPLRIERDYPGGSKGVWEVLEWEVVPLAQVDKSIFELSSIPISDLEEERLYWLGEIAKFDEFPVWWLGEQLGDRSAQRQENLVDKGDHTETVPGEQQFFYRRGGDLVKDPLTGGAKISIDYLGSGLDTVTVTSMRPLPDASLVELLAEETGATHIRTRQARSGVAAIGRSDEGIHTALVKVDGALVMIETRDGSALLRALDTLCSVSAPSTD